MELERRLTAGTRVVVHNIDYRRVSKVPSLFRLVYGVSVLKINSKGRNALCRFYLDERDKTILRWIEKRENSRHARLMLTTLTKIDFPSVAKSFLKCKTVYEKSLCVTLLFRHKTLNLIFGKENEMMEWLSGILYLFEEAFNIHTQCFNPEVEVADQIWGIADKNHDEVLSFKEIRDMVGSMNLHINSEDLQKLFTEFDENENQVLEKTECNNLIETLMQRPELTEIFLHYSDGLEYMSKTQFLQFLEEVQGSTEDSSEIFDTLAEEFKGDEIINNRTFRAYILNPSINSIINPGQGFVCMDMTQPLTHYFIASSHNTYLEGNQLTSISSSYKYSKVLLEGCRCIEVDTWDGDCEPVVTHGHTLVGTVPFREVLEEVKKSAFITSPYPVIFSMENHCNKSQTEIIGYIFKEILGDAIFVAEDSLLSPEELKYKFLIKGKIKNSKKNAGKPASSYSSVLCLVGSEFSLTQNFNAITSLRETKLHKCVKRHGCGQMVEYHCRNLTRIYPKGGRVNSSNYNPLNFWIFGSQIAAINYQSPDIGTLINNAWFLSNGRSGYVLKPAYMREDPGLLDIHQINSRNPMATIHIEVLSAFNLPKFEGDSEIVSPYVEVEVIGIANDTCLQSTTAVHRNGFNPVWKEKFSFGVRLLEMCVVIFTVKSKSHLNTRKIAQNAIPIYCIRKGIRVIELVDSKLELLPNSYLICKIEIGALD